MASRTARLNPGPLAASGSMPRLATFAKVLAVPAAVALWLGLGEAVGSACSHFYPFCGPNRLWIELVLIPLVVALIVGANVMRRTRTRAVLLALLSGAAAYGAGTAFVEQLDGWLWASAFVFAICAAMMGCLLTIRTAPASGV